MYDIIELYKLQKFKNNDKIQLTESIIIHKLS